MMPLHKRAFGRAQVGVFHYSTVTINLAEVVDYDEVPTEPVSFLEEIKEAIKESWENFVDGLEDFILWLIFAFPTLVIGAVLIVFGIFIVRKIKHKRKTKKKNIQKPAENTIDNEKPKQ